MKIETFELERWQSIWENRVEYNLAESGVHPMTVAELVGEGGAEELLGKRLLYNPTQGTPELRQLIGNLYDGAGPDNVLVTQGACEANFLALWSLVEPGDEVVVMLPNYLQIWGLARGFGADARSFRLREELGWVPDLDELRCAVSPRTKLIAVCNPNNPTGAVLSDAAMWEIVELARQCGAWLLADEVYCGAERDGRTTASFWGRYEKVLATGGLSKAYGTPGLRVGWVVAPEEMVGRLWSCKDYTTIAVATLSDALACRVLEARGRIIERTRGILRANFPIIEKWVADQRDVFSMVPAAAGAIACLRYTPQIESTRLMKDLIREESVLVCPGEHFGLGNFIRINYGLPAGYLRAGLERVAAMMREITAPHSAASAARATAGDTWDDSHAL